MLTLRPFFAHAHVRYVLHYCTVGGEKRERRKGTLQYHHTYANVFSKRVTLRSSCSHLVIRQNIVLWYMTIQTYTVVAKEEIDPCLQVC